MHFSKQLMHPSWFCYAMRENSPLKGNIDKWYLKVINLIHLLAEINGTCYVRVRRFSQFGLHLKWYEVAKIEYSNWKIAMRNSGKPVS